MTLGKPSSAERHGTFSILIAPGERGLNLGCGRDVKPSPWVNVDAFYEAEGVLRHDLSKLPWPFEDESFDVVYASHVLEHVPLVYEEVGGIRRDLLFGIMEEIHRVLKKPGGRLIVRVPHGADAHIAFGHPQHYRFWLPSWFGYFHPDGDENYYSTARFRLLKHKLVPWGVRWPDAFPIRGLGIMSHLAARIPLFHRALKMGNELVMWAEALPHERSEGRGENGSSGS